MLEFLKEWLEFAETGKSKAFLFNSALGLCDSAFEWDEWDKHSSVRLQLKARLREDFRHQIQSQDRRIDGKSFSEFPFNDGSSSAFTLEVDKTKNEERLAWVRKTIKELEKQKLKTSVRRLDTVLEHLENSGYDKDVCRVLADTIEELSNLS